ncbi:PAS domain S-box protein [Variovorax sp. LARHSF232]
MTPGPSLPGMDSGAVFRSLFAAYPDALLLVDRQGVIRLANPMAVELLGYAAAELEGLPVDQLVPDAIRPRHAAYRQAYATQPRARPMGTQIDLVARRRDGSEVMVEIALSPLQDHGLPYVVAAIRSVAEYPRVKQALQRARYAEHVAQFGRLAVDAPDTQTLMARTPALAAEALQVEMAKILMLEPNGRELRISAGIGLLPEEAVGDRLAIEPGSPAGHVVAQGRPVLVSGDGQEGGFAMAAPYRRAGFVCELSVPLSDRGRTLGALTVRSRTPRRFGEDEVRFLESLSSMLATVLQRSSSEEALQHAQRLESVGQLTGGVAHDFNNLLTVISGNLQVLEDAPAYAQDPLVRQVVNAASRATRRGAELTGKLLAFSRRQVLQPAVVDTLALLNSLTDMLRRTLDQRLTISLDAQALHCLADPVQLESALLNVAINARDAMPQGGTLAITCRAVDTLPAVPAPEGPAAPAAGGYVAIAISDTGVGMPETVRERAFEPFFTTKEAGRGTGLGLSTVYGFATQSGGTVALDSSPGAGTSVTLYLPRVDAPAAIGTPPEGARPGRVPPGLRVLLVEDDTEVRQVVQAFLAAMACEVIDCASADDALAVLDSDTPVHLLLSDIVLGAGMRGTELAEVARAQLPGLPVLLMSGYSSDLLEGPHEWELLSKPYTRADLERAMLRVLGAASA